MPSNRREIEVESIKTPKGNVPTVKGLESGLNAIYDDLKPIASDLSSLDKSLTGIIEKLDHYEEKMNVIAQSLAEIVTYLGKLDSSIKQNHELVKKQLYFEQTDLITLKNELASILEKIQLEVSIQSSSTKSK
ncbi:MAG: hypothetical protein ACTSPG_06560 [Candidatus Hodarchaeales archaeon]